MVAREPKNKRPRRCHAAACAQHGAVLVVGLVILLVITMLGVSGQQATLLQERMAGNMRQNDIALQAAEAALTAGLAYVEEHDGPILATLTGSNFVWTSCRVADVGTAGIDSNHPCNRMDAVLADWRDKTPDKVTKGNSYREIASKTETNFGGDIPGVIAQPRIYVELRSVLSDDLMEAAKGVGTHFYTVSAVGFGTNERARVVLQSTIAKQIYR
jgi:type IV pilus assembly protein PilX